MTAPCAVTPDEKRVKMIIDDLMIIMKLLAEGPNSDTLWQGSCTGRVYHRLPTHPQAFQPLHKHNIG